ncbi:MAG: DUF3014 domain-containing protein [Acidobacteriota bacterium]
MQRPVVIAIAIIVALVLAVVVYMSFSGDEPAPEPAPPPTTMPAPIETPPPEPEPAPIVLPPLEESDPMLLSMIEGLSAHPRLDDVVDIDGIAQTFVLAVVSIANGESPRGPLEYLAPEADFAIAERDGRVVIDPASFERYTWITGVFSSIDATGAAEMYDQLEPLFDEAYHKLGYPDGRFRDALDAAMNLLAATPVPEGYVEVRRGNVLWEFRDPALEALSPPQKHLLRMGPANARLVQSKIREIQAALGR